MENNMTVKTGKNAINVAGVIKQHNLNSGASKKDGSKYINGSFTVKAGEFTEVRIKVMAYEKTKSGNLNKTYQTLSNILNKQYKTMADKVSEEEAVKVSVWGNVPFSPQFREEIYCTEDSASEDKAVTRVDMNLGFGNVTIKEKLDPSDYKAEFDVDVYVNGVVQEEKDGAITGRAIIKGIVPTYQGSAFPMDIIAGTIKDPDGDIDFGQQVLAQVYEGITLNLFGDINHQAIIEKVRKGGSLGKAKIEEKRTYIHELVAQGADVMQGESAFDQEAIRNAMIKRQEEMDKAVAEFGNKKTKTKGLGGMPSVKSGIAEDDEIPF